MIRFTAEQKKFILENYKGIGNKELTQQFNQKFNTNLDKQIYYFKRNNHLDSGLTGRFEKGHKSHNKGKKWDDYLTQSQQMKAKKTCFKKGNIPHNHRPIGSERITVDGYVEVKVAEPNKWKLKANIIYENVYGEIPENHKIIYLDGNRQNLDITNLKAISCAEELIMNRQKLRYNKKELTECGILIAKIINKSSDIKNERL